MLKEFREFIAKGNMLDLAVGIVIGAAFTAIVNSLVKDLLNPIIGLAGKANFDNMFLVLREGDPTKAHDTPALAQAAGYVTLNYGAFLTAFINFLIVAFALFLIVKAANKMKRKAEEVAAEPEIPNSEKLLTEIRDLLRAKV
ncbi:MAG TPA: large conductance mechanosensitive channel protein MscL [Fimbriimonadaceae bacterium]|nr:large conductance mechanosensitive channel protein MscL [Fimbriimonadaceae bacterium]